MSGLSVVVVSYDSAGWLRGCLDALLASATPGLAICVVDNASADESAALVETQFPGVALVRSAVNLGFAGGANLGVRASASDVAVVMNPDVTVQPSTVPTLLTALESDAKAGLAGARLLYPDGKTIQHAGGVLPYPLALADHHGHGQRDRGRHERPREVQFVTGALFAVRRSVFEEVGGFDEGFYPAYFEDTDLCFRLREAGYRVLYVPGAAAIHHESVTTGKNTPGYYRFYHRNRVRFVLKHYSDRQLLADFRPAELARLGQIPSYVEVTALRQAYADNLAVLAGRADFFANRAAVAPLDGGEERLRMLRELESRAEALVASRQGAGGALSEQMRLLGVQSQVAEPGFSSGAPVVGPLVVRFRELWNWMSTRWYVRPILRQQNEFNALVVEALRDLDLGVRSLRASVDAGEGAGERPGADLEALERRLQRVEERLASLQRLLDERGDR